MGAAAARTTAIASPVEHAHRGTPRGEPSGGVDVDDLRTRVPPSASSIASSIHSGAGSRTGATLVGAPTSPRRSRARGAACPARGRRRCWPSARRCRAWGRPVARRRATRARSSSSAPRPRSTRPGCATEPPVSVPSATSASSFATATAEPLDEPPGIKSASSGFTGVPNHGFTPSAPKASSTRLVFPTIRASAAHAAGEAEGVGRGRRRAGGQVLAAGGGRHAGHVDEVLDREPRPDGAARISWGDEGCDGRTLGGQR